MTSRSDNGSTQHLQPPQSMETEVQVLGSILKKADAVNEVLEVLDSPDHFYAPKHKHIFEAVLSLYHASEPCDITTVADELRKMGRLESIGGRSYLVTLVESIISTANVDRHAAIVLERSVLRQLIATSSEIQESCYRLDRPADELLDQAEASIFQISQRRQKVGFVSIEEPFRGIFDRIAADPDSIVEEQAIPTGYTQLDQITDGMHNGDLIIVAGRPSMGKTALAMNFAEHVAVDLKKGVGIFSLEMSKEQLVMRMLCGRARVNQKRVRSNKLTQAERNQLAVKGGILAQAPIFVDDSSALSPLEMRAKARRLKSRYDIGLFIVDYIQLMHATGRAENRQQEIAMISRSMKALAKDLDVPVIAISQLSRLVEQRGASKRPQLSDLRESGAIEQDADVVMFVYREEYYLSHLDKDDPKYREAQGKAEVIVAKQRNGPTDTAHLAFVRDYTRFENLDPVRHELPPGADWVGQSTSSAPPTNGGETPPDSPF